MKATYSNVHKFTWGQLTEELKQPYHLPLTVHLPIQPLHSPDFIHVDAALNVSRRRIFQNLSISDHVAFKKAQESETFVVQFALDEGPFVPDARLSTMRLAEGKYPVAMADYFAWDLHYQFEYASVSPITLSSPPKMRRSWITEAVSLNCGKIRRRAFSC